jgi:hypothetical protein
MDYGGPLFNFTMQDLTKAFYIKSKDKLRARGDWDGDPIVIETYKLIFFTISLKYLNDYDIGVASDMITGNEYTKAIVARNPKLVDFPLPFPC